MPGIYGQASDAPAEGLAERLAAAADAMRHHPWYQDDRWRDAGNHIGFGRISTGCVNAASQPTRSGSGNLIGVMEGEVYDYAARRQELEAAGQKFAGNSHAELIVRGIELYGPAYLNRIDGKFVVAVWDARSRRLHLANDRFGMKPVYYCHRAGRLSFASEIKALLTDPAMTSKLDVRGLAQFFTFGQLFGEDTLFTGIRLLSAATCLTYDAARGQVSSETYWRLSGGVRSSVDRTGALDRIDGAFADSVRRMSAGTSGLGLSLSGGLDARAILGVMDAETPITSLSLGMAGSLDHRCAAELARLAGSRHHQVMLGEAFLTDFERHLRHMVRLTDGQYVCQCIVMPTLPVYRDVGVRVLLRGHAGELMHMTKAYNFSLDAAGLQVRDEAGLFNWLWRHLQAYMLDGTDGRLFAPALRGDVEGLARESLADAVRRTAATVPIPHRIWQVFLEQRSRRETALSLAEFESVVETRLPYLDRELVEALFAVPPDLKLDDTIQTYVLRRRRPSFLQVANANTGARMGAGVVSQLAARVRGKVLAKLGVPGYQPYERLGLWLRRELRPMVERLLLSDRSLGRGVFDPQTVRTVVGDHLDNRVNHTFLVLALLVFEVGQQEFFDNSAPSPAAARRTPQPVCGAA
jgi:asparagine synthase (glutamine-hydrolysing)